MNNNVVEFQNEETRLFEIPNGSTRLVKMPQLWWDNVRFLFVVEGITQREIAAKAEEEQQLQDISFSDAVQCVVAELGNRWE